MGTMYSLPRFSATLDRYASTRALALFVFIMVAAAACGASAAEPNSSKSLPADTTTESTADDASGDISDTAQAESEEPDASANASEVVGGSFELVLENGTTFSAPIQCALEPQDAAGSEILFQAGGGHEGQVYDVTQWGETEFGGTQDVEIYDSASYETLWRATGSTGLVLELNGNVISGSGGFYEGDDINGPRTQGVLTVTC